MTVYATIQVFILNVLKAFLQIVIAIFLEPSKTPQSINLPMMLCEIDDSLVDQMVDCLSEAFQDIRQVS